MIFSLMAVPYIRPCSKIPPTFHRHVQSTPSPDSKKSAKHENQANRLALTDRLTTSVPTTIKENFQADIPESSSFLEDTFPSTAEAKTNNVFIKFFECTNKVFADQTGPLSFPSSRGYQYVMIVYNYDTNHPTSKYYEVIFVATNMLNVCKNDVKMMST